jgi:hypothetical protein
VACIAARACGIAARSADSCAAERGVEALPALAVISPVRVIHGAAFQAR